MPATLEDIINAIKAQDVRFAALRAAILANPTAPLPTGTWTVRDALSHVAARAMLTSTIRNAEARLKAATENRELPRINIDDVNHGQVVERQNATVAELLAEIEANHAKTIEEVKTLPEAQLSKMYTTVQGAQVTGADLIFGNVSRHESGHTNDVEAAINAVQSKR
jgi:hypothetical protein